MLISKNTPSLFSFDKQFPKVEESIFQRRQFLEQSTRVSLTDLPFKGLDYDRIKNVNCENLIGYIPIPVGVAGPLLVDGKPIYFPLSTTEGALVASANRGAKAITDSNGVKTEILRDGITRGPVVRLESLEKVRELCEWIDDAKNFALLKKTVEQTSPHISLKKVTWQAGGRFLFMRFVCSTGDAMGMNMVGVGTEKALKVIAEHFPLMDIISLSGNFCIDKKSSALNWIEGRGKTVVAEANIKRDVIKSVLKTTPERMVEVNTAKNLVGSSLAGAIGGNNAHAANLVAALFIACGQDPAQVVDTSQCLTLMEIDPNGDLQASVTMPTIEVGTVGGGTHLGPQRSSLRLMGLKVDDKNVVVGSNAKRLASIVASVVLAGELSLIAALASGDLMNAHLKLNRKQENTKEKSEQK